MMKNKQIIRLLAIAGIAGNLLSGCTKHQGQEAALSPEPDLSAPIEFSEVISDTQSPDTKGLNPLNNVGDGIELQGFGVFSWWNPRGEAFDELHNPVNIYQNNNPVQEVDFTTTPRKWKCNPTAYWPLACNLSFFAYAPYLEHTQPYMVGDETVQPELRFPSADFTQGMPRATFTPDVSVANQVDFCIAAPVFDCPPSDDAIHLAFKHALTMIRLYVKLTGTPMPNTKYRITDAIISGVAGTNTFTYRDNAAVPFVWDEVTDSTPKDGEYHLTKERSELVSTAMNHDINVYTQFKDDYIFINGVDQGRIYILPQNLSASAQLELGLSTYIGNSSEVSSIFPPFRMTLPSTPAWQPGKVIAYQVTLDVSSATVTSVTAVIVDWADSYNSHIDQIIY